MDSMAFCLETATMETISSMLHSITLLPLDNLGVSPVGHEQDEPSSRQSLPQRIFNQVYPEISAKLLDVDLYVRVWEHNVIDELNIPNFAWLSNSIILFVVQRISSHHVQQGATVACAHPLFGMYRQASRVFFVFAGT